MQHQTLQPLLPPELERKIAEMAFDPDNHLSTARVMSLVARRFHEWIRPLIYSVFDQGSINPFPNFALPTTPHIHEIGKYAHNMLLGYIHKHPHDICQLLAHCPSVRNLALWYSRPLRKILPALRNLDQLRILSGDFDNIPRADILKPPFTHLTHMEMLEPAVDFPFDVLASFIRLTHISIYCFNPIQYDPRTFSSALDSCLQLIVCCLYSSTGTRMNLDSCSLVQDRDRIVILDSSMSNTDDWMSGAYGFLDCWQYAENVVIARKNHYFKPEVSKDECFSSTFEWNQNLTARGIEWYSTRQSTQYRVKEKT